MKNKFVRDRFDPRIIREVLVELEDIITTDDEMMDVFYTLQKTEYGDFLIYLNG